MKIVNGMSSSIVVTQEKAQGPDFCGESHGYCLLGQLQNLVSVILEERCHNQFTAICAGSKEVKATNSKGSAKQENGTSPPL
jgi:hypothetical protein